MERESRNTSPAWASAVALRTRQRWTSIQPSGGVQSGTLLWEGIQVQTVPWINKPLIRCQKSGKSPSQRPVLMPRWSRRTKAWLSIKSITGLLAAEEAKQACRRAARSPAAGVCSKPVTAPWTVVPESVETAQLALCHRSQEVAMIQLPSKPKVGRWRGSNCWIKVTKAGSATMLEKGNTGGASTSGTSKRRSVALLNSPSHGCAWQWKVRCSRSGDRNPHSQLKAEPKRSVTLPSTAAPVKTLRL